MSWLSKALGKVGGAGNVLPALASVALPGVGGVLAGGALKTLGSVGKTAAKVLPGVGMVAGGTVAGELISSRFTASGKRRRGRGFSARDVRQTKRFMKILKEVSAAAPKRMSSSRSVVNTCGCK